MKMLCKENHWEVKDGQLLLKTPTDTDTETARSVIKTLEAQLRLKIYDEICALKVTENRQAIVKAGIDNVALTVQAMCADVALGKRDA